MLSKLIVKNFAIIEDIEVSFYEGVNVILGETGAGKSILIDALGLLLGNRSSLDKIRNGESRAFIEGEFIIDEKTKKEINDEFDSLLEDDTLIVSRQLDNNGKSSMKINFRSAPLSVGKALVSKLLDIHSQHKDHSFFDKNKQIYLLDSFILKLDEKNRIEELYENGESIYSLYKKEYAHYLEEKKKLKKMEEDYVSLDEIETLEYQYNELEKANIQENELENIEDELRTLNNFEKLEKEYSTFSSSYKEASSLLYSCKKALGNIQEDDFSELKEKFISLYFDIEDVYESLETKFSSYEEKLYKIEELTKRRSLLKSLSRKYGRTTSDILMRFEEIKHSLDLASNYDFEINKQNKIIKEIESKLDISSSKISSLRRKGGDILSSLLNKEMKELLLENASFKVDIKEASFNEEGKDDVSFLLCANKGGKYLPLEQSASLGESSRLNLALKTVFNSLNPIGTIIFDEIDTGISGRVGVATSYKLQKISENSQTIIISHLPQVASIGNHHFFVKKVVIDDVTKSQIHEMNEDELVKEIALMLSGSSLSDSSLLAAKELINQINIK